MSAVPEAKQTDEGRTPAPDWWDYLQRARAELEAAGATFSSGEEIQSYIKQLRGEPDPGDSV